MDQAEQLAINFDTTEYDRERSIRTILTRGRAYPIKGGKHVSLHVYGTSEQGMHGLVANFGGNFYPHQQGFQWQLAKRDQLLLLRNELRASVGELSPGAQKRLALLLDLSAIEPESSDELQAVAAVAAT